MSIEFDPTSEKHYPALIVKFIDPGCTFELQIEEAHTGLVTRITSTESPEHDQHDFEQALLDAFRREMKAHGF